MKPFRYGKGKARHRPGVMNKLELSYSQHLDQLKHLGEVLWWSFECLKFRLADKTFYTPDFLLMKPDMTLEVHEVKGFWEDDARVKIKVAAETFPMKFVAVTKEKGQWVFEEFAM